MNVATVSSNRPGRRTLRRGAAQGDRTRIRELDALVLRLPPGAYPLVPHAAVKYLPIVRDEGHPWAPLVPGIQWLDAPHIIPQVCTTRAIETVDATLTIAGRRSVTPERYLRHWRERIAHSIAIDQAPWLFGVRPVARLVFDRRAIDVAKTRWRTRAADAFDGLLERHPAVMSCELAAGGGADGTPDANAAQTLRLTVDLTTQHGAGDAWWLQDYLLAGPDNPYPLKAWVECLRGLQVLPQAVTPQESPPTHGGAQALECGSPLECTP